MTRRAFTQEDHLVKADRLAAMAIEFDAALREMMPGSVLNQPDVQRVQKAAEAFGLALKEYEEIRGREWIPPQDQWFDP